MEESEYEPDDEADQCVGWWRHSRRGEGRQMGLAALLEKLLVIVLDKW